MKKNKAFVLLSLLSVLALVACQSPVDNFAKVVKATGSGRVAVTVHSATRTLVADAAAAVTSYAVTLTSQAGQAPINAQVASGAGTAAFDAVPTGTWDVHVTAYAGSSVVGLGTLNNQPVADGDSLVLQVPVTTTQTASGAYSFAFSLPAASAVNAVSAQLYHTDATGESAFGALMNAELTFDSSETTGVLANPQLPSGAYRLKLTFHRGGPAGPVAKVDTEAVNVFDNLTSNLWINAIGTLQDRKDYALGDFKAATFYDVVAQRGWTGQADSNVRALVNGPAGSVYSLYQNNGVSMAGVSDNPIVQYDSNHQVLRNINLLGINIEDFTVDAEGSVFVVGNFHLGSLGETLPTEINASEYPGDSSWNGFHPILVKVNPEGQIVWAKSASVTTHVDNVPDGADYGIFSSVRVFGSGVDQVVDVAGEVDQASTYDFGNGIQAQGSPLGNSLVIQYGTDGQPHWARTQATTGETGSSSFSSLSLDSDGNLYAGGNLSGQGIYTFEGAGADQPLTVTLHSDTIVDTAETVLSSLVLAKYSPTGTPLWVQMPVSTAGNSLSKVAVDAQGNVFAIGGMESGTTDFGISTGNNSYSFSPAVGGTPFLAKYDADGWLQWVTSGDTDTPVNFSNLTLGPNGEITVVGFVTGSTSTSVSGLSVTGGYAAENALVVRYGNDGGSQWARTATYASNLSQYNAVVSDPAGRILVGGLQFGTGEFDYGGGITLTGTGVGYSPLFVQYQ